MCIARVHITLLSVVQRLNLTGLNPSEQTRRCVDFAAVLAFPIARRSAGMAGKPARIMW